MTSSPEYKFNCLINHNCIALLRTLCRYRLMLMTGDSCADFWNLRSNNNESPIRYSGKHGFIKNICQHMWCLQMYAQFQSICMMYMNEEESEEFHIKATVTSNEALSYQKPLLTTESLIAVAVRNLDPQNKNGASFWKIVAFISLHFPYFDVNFETCKQLVKKAYGQNPNDEKEPTGSFRIKPAVVQRLYAEISPVLKKDKLDIEKSMLHPKFLDIMVERFLEGEKYKQVMADLFF